MGSAQDSKLDYGPVLELWIMAQPMGRLAYGIREWTDFLDLPDRLSIAVFLDRDVISMRWEIYSQHLIRLGHSNESILSIVIIRWILVQWKYKPLTLDTLLGRHTLPLPPPLREPRGRPRLDPRGVCLIRWFPSSSIQNKTIKYGKEIKDQCTPFLFICPSGLVLFVLLVEEVSPSTSKSSLLEPSANDSTGLFFSLLSIHDDISDTGSDRVLLIGSSLLALADALRFRSRLFSSLKKLLLSSFFWRSARIIMHWIHTLEGKIIFAYILSRFPHRPITTIQLLSVSVNLVWNSLH